MFISQNSEKQICWHLQINGSLTRCGNILNWSGSHCLLCSVHVTVETPGEATSKGCLTADLFHSFQPFEDWILLKLGPYRVVNTRRFGYKDQSASVCTEINAISCDIHPQHSCTVCWHNEEFSVLNLEVYIVISRLYRIKCLSVSQSETEYDFKCLMVAET